MTLASASESTLASSVRSHTLMDKCEIERNPISLVGSESARRCTPEVLHTDVLFVGLDNERQCPNSCPICLGIQRSRSMASVALQVCVRHSESTVRFDAEDHDACETLV